MPTQLPNILEQMGDLDIAATYPKCFQDWDESEFPVPENMAEELKKIPTEIKKAMLYSFALQQAVDHGVFICDTREEDS